jgi:site-specific recombinase XerD
MGTWRTLKEELTHESDEEATVRSFSEVYLNEYCRVRNRRPDFKEETLQNIVKILGEVNITDVRRKHAHFYASERAKDGVMPGTINRGLAVLKNMMTFALEKELIELHPLLKFRLIPEEECALRVLTLQEERKLVESMPSLVSQAYIAILGETGLRMTEGFTLKWELVDLKNRLLTVEKTKSGKARTIPSLSDYAMEWLELLPKDSPYVFTCPSTGDRYHDLRYPLELGREAAGLTWVGFHDLRHFRATQWVKEGVDLRTVQGLMGHHAIQTTMRYVHFAPTPANRSLIEAQRREAEEWQRAKSGQQRAAVVTNGDQPETPTN